VTLAPLIVFSRFTVPTHPHDGHGGGAVGVMGFSGIARQRWFYTDSRARLQPLAHYVFNARNRNAARGWSSQPAGAHTVRRVVRFSRDEPQSA